MTARRIPPEQQAPRPQLSIKGVVVTQARGDHIVATKWPRKRGPNGTPAQMAARQFFRDLVQSIKNAEAPDRETAMAYTPGTPLTWRDILMQAYSAKLMVVTDPDGAIWRGTRDVSDEAQALLNSISQTPGTVLIRGADKWIATYAPTRPNQVLTSVGAPRYAMWSNPVVGGAPADALGTRVPVHPDGNDFNWLASSQGDATITAFGSYGFTIEAHAVNAVNLRLAGLTLPSTTPWTVIAGLRVQAALNQNYFNAGLALKHSGGAKVTTWGLSLRNDPLSIQRVHWNAINSYNSGPFDVQAKGQPVAQLVWLRIDNDGTNYIFSFSNDGLGWIPCTSEALTNWLANPADEIALFVDPENSSGAPISLTCFDWEVF